MEELKTTTTGWVIINIGHPRTGNKYIVASTFSRTRTGAIKEFCSESGTYWKYWKEKFNFRVVRAEQTITTK